MRLHGFHTLPGVYQHEKTTIKQGFIVRELVWKDTMGNELEKISDRPPKFVVKKSYNGGIENTAESRLRDYFADKGFEIQFRKNNNINLSEENASEAEIEEILHFVIFVSSLILLFLSSFYLGYAVALWKKSHKSIETEIQNLPPIEEFQISA